MTRIMTKQTKNTLKIDGKSFSIERLAKAIVLQETENDMDALKFSKELDRKIKEEKKKIDEGDL